MTALAHAIPAVHNPKSGRYDAVRLSEVLAVSTEEIAQAVGYTARGIRNNPDSERLQPDLERIVIVLQRLRELTGSLEHARIWLKAPHPFLGYRTPLSFLLDGRVDVIEDMIRMIETGQPT